MNTVKEVAKMTGISIRTLRYYDEIGLLKPTKLTKAGYRLYDGKALEKLQQILFFRELEIPLVDIKEIMVKSNFDRQKILLVQKSLLEKKRDRLNGIIELISDVLKGENKMSFEAFNEEDANQILRHMESNLSKDDLDKLVQKYGSFENYRDSFTKGLQDEKNNAVLIKWYGSKEKAKESAFEPIKDLSLLQNENKEIYTQLYQLIGAKDLEKEKVLVTRLVECYKKMFQLENARAMLLDLAKEYMNNEKLREANDSLYGKGCSEYVAKVIQCYYGI